MGSVFQGPLRAPQSKRSKWVFMRKRAPGLRIGKFAVITSWPQVRNRKGTALTEDFFGSKMLQASLMIPKQLPSSPLNSQLWGILTLAQGWCDGPLCARPQPQMGEHCLMRKPTPPRFWLPGQWGPKTAYSSAELIWVYLSPGPNEGVVLSSKCGLSLSSALGRKTVWSCSYFLHGVVSVTMQHLFNPISTPCRSSHRSQSSVQEQSNRTWFVHQEGTCSLQWVRWSIIFA